MQEMNIPIQKVTLLYIAAQAPGLRRSQLQDAALATLSMDYFDMATALDELVEAGLIHIGTRKGEEAMDAHNRSVERCDLTDKGLIVLDALRSQIPPATRRFITQYLSERGFQRKIADSITARIELASDGQYEVICRQKEGDETSFHLVLRFPTEDMARKAAESWRERSSDVMRALMEVLLQNESNSKED